MQTLRIVPDVRSSVVEEMPAGQVLLFTSQRGDADAALLTHPAVHPFTWPRLLRALRDPELELLEVAEPLWLGEWVRALRYVVLLRLLRPRRPRVAVATYAIENLDARERCRFPSLDGRPRLGAVVSRVVLAALGLSVRALDVVVFGTSGAAENYRRAFGRSLRARHTVLTPRLGPCSVCGPVPAGGPRDRTVLFLGTPGERKGFSVLTAAWERSDAAARGWRLVVADPTGGDGRSLPDGVGVTTPTRAEVHELLRRSAVVAMPSVRRRGWREQIGLPLVEGLAHGCRVVTTTETGLADDLRDHPQVTLTTPGDVAGLAEGLLRAMQHDGTTADTTDDTSPTPGTGGWTKRDVVAWWLDEWSVASPAVPTP